MAGCVRRLEASRAKLRSLFPLRADQLEELGPGEEEGLDAFLKRFEQLVTTIQDQVFRAIALAEAEDLAGMSRRDVAERMERLGAIPSAGQFRDLVVLRNRLSHLYPDDPGRQVAILNAAWAGSTALLDAAGQLNKCVDTKGYMNRPN
jgi:hypothetical protein